MQKKFEAILGYGCQALLRARYALVVLKFNAYTQKRFEIEKFLGAVTPRDSVKYVKPDTEHLEATLNALAAKPEEAIVVGDCVSDMRCARELKAIAVGLPTGILSPRKLVDSGANYIITSITDPPMLIKQVNLV